MMTSMRYVLLVLGIIISLHYILSFSHEGYGRATSLSNIKEHLYDVHQPPYKTPVPDEYYLHDNHTVQLDRKANAAIVILARNGDINGVVSSVKQMEDRFNKKFSYPYVFLNEEPFEESFKSRVSALTDATVEFGLIPADNWHQPSWIDEANATASREEMMRNNVIYGGNVPYRNMCRFNSGFFYRQELLQKYRYYWRPDVKFYCDLDYDPFLIMQDQKKVYGFTISLPEYEATIPTLWDTVKEFIAAHPDLVSPDNAMDFLSDDGGVTYNRCHFWSNFEIGDLELWRGEAYTKFFDFLDQKGGFYYERWGDAPVHSIGAALFARKDQIHFFNDIGWFTSPFYPFSSKTILGYRHEPFQHCPQGDSHKRGKCWCDSTQNFGRPQIISIIACDNGYKDYDWYSCLTKYDRMFT
ncbi:glycosyltransferase family 15 protein [Infundibulicybe gibba]|nr:glycosyltransferase family 15 protein [Infundibulicybe gibba]